MVGDVNIFLTDPTEPFLAELEIMIAGNNCFLITSFELCTSVVFDFLNFYMFLEPNYRGKGIGKEVTRMMMLYGNYYHYYYYAKLKDG